MIPFSFQNDFLTVGCNRVQQCVAWARNGCQNYMAYGANNTVALCHPSSNNPSHVRYALKGHTDRVNCVSYISKVCTDNGSVTVQEIGLVSGSSDKTARIWMYQDDNWSCTAVLEGHTDSVTSIASIDIGSDLWIATTSADGSVKLWTLDGVCFQTLTFGTIIPLCIALTSIGTIPILAVGCSNCQIRLYGGKTFNYLTSLTGHENWIRSLSFTTLVENSPNNDFFAGDVLLASAGQDKYIRVWRLFNDQLLPTSASMHLDNGSIVSSMNRHTFKLADSLCYSVRLESILMGHDHWVYSVQWFELYTQTSSSLRLLSSSMDRTMMIWIYDDASKIFFNRVRVGTHGGEALGFFGGVIGDRGRTILAHSYTGGFHAWQQNNDQWKPLSTVSGHVDIVEDLSFDPTGTYIITLSKDQTTRIFSPWIRDVPTSTKTEKCVSWHEIARPQIHGYDMVCLAAKSPFRFVSGADEKVLRIFDAPQSFIDDLYALTGNRTSVDPRLIAFESQMKSRPKSANVPALGLTNKAIFNHAGEDDEKGKLDENEDNYSQPTPVDNDANGIQELSTKVNENRESPPLEEGLLMTLWPETEKLYGHGNEISAVAVHADVMVSACKAAKPEDAVVIVWDLKNFQRTQTLPAHKLTVTQMAFSNDGNMLLSVSRDRHFVLWTKGITGYERQSIVNAHDRIIWACGFTPDDSYFITASRDKTIKIWKTACPERAVASFLMKAGVTAISFAPLSAKGMYYFACGLEDGALYVGAFNNQNEGASIDGKIEIFPFREEYCPAGAVRKIGFSPNVNNLIVDSANPIISFYGDTQTGCENVHKFQFACASDDHSVRVYTVHLK